MNQIWKTFFLVERKYGATKLGPTLLIQKTLEQINKFCRAGIEPATWQIVNAQALWVQSRGVKSFIFVLIVLIQLFSDAAN